MINELYKKAGEIHGHYCPGLAVGVRAAYEANRILDLKSKGFNLYCITESRACYMDGIQVVFGATMGNNNIEIRQRGKTAFNFYDRTSGKSVRLIGLEWPEGLSKEETTDFILHAPFEKIFMETPVHFEAPANKFKRPKSIKCSKCGELCAETFIRINNGEMLCLDCFEALV